MRVAIHQPNYLPWLGYFYKMAIADKFVLLDNVQFSKGSYQNRTKILTPGGVKWLTVPVLKSGNFKASADDIMFSPTNWQKKHLGTLENNYRRTRFFDCFFEEIKELFSCQKSDNLSEFNISLIKWAAQKLEIKTELLVASNLNAGKIYEDPNSRLIDLVKSCNGKTYIHGKGGLNYQDASIFEKENIDLEPSGFTIFNYSQQWGSDFEGGLSVIDYLFNEGEAGVHKFRELVNQNRCL
jgi:hypothetical protein